jgi:integrase
VLREGETVGLPYEVDETYPKAKHAPKAENRRIKLDPYAVAAIRLLIVTGARLRKILDAQWQHVDFEHGILFLPDSKTGRKPVYLSAPAMQVLASLPRLEGNPYIIAGMKDAAPRADLKKPWAAVTKAAGLDGARIHDLRHSFASIGAGASLGLPVIGKLLGHSQPSTTARWAARPTGRKPDSASTGAGRSSVSCSQGHQAARARARGQARRPDARRQGTFIRCILSRRTAPSGS